jgi:hypothetical protein
MRLNIYHYLLKNILLIRTLIKILTDTHLRAIGVYEAYLS